MINEIRNPLNKEYGMAEKLGLVPKVLIVSNQQTTGPLWVFSLQQQKLNDEAQKFLDSLRKSAKINYYVNY